MMRRLGLAWIVLAVSSGWAAPSRNATAEEKRAADQDLLAFRNSPWACAWARAVHLPWGTPVNAPGEHDNEFILHQRDYLTGYDSDLRVPVWVAYRLRAESLTPGPDVDSSRIEAFRPDPRLPTSEAVTHADYTRTGYSRGHMAPNADFVFGLIPMINTYVMTNMCPQVQAFNGGIWSYLESRVRSWARARGMVWVVTGALFDADADGRRDADDRAWRIGPKAVAVPTGFYKIIVARQEGRVCALAITLPHVSADPAGLSAAQRLQAGVRSVDDLEAMTGMNLLAGLPDDEERRLEATPEGLWP